MSIELIGGFSQTEKQAIDAFAVELERVVGYSFSGRLVIAEPHLSGITRTMSNELARWMKDDEYAEWRAQQHNRPVATGGKTFVADDGIVTAVVCPMPNLPAEFLGVSAHELIEICHRVQEERNGRIEPEGVREIHGVVLYDEYAVERIRQSISTALGWTESRLDAEPGLVSQIDDLLHLLPGGRAGHPPTDFWAHWVNIARVWAMTEGRRAAGSTTAAAELDRCSKHPLIRDKGWKPVSSSLDRIFLELGLHGEVQAERAAKLVWDPIESYGRAAWADPAVP